MPLTNYLQSIEYGEFDYSDSEYRTIKALNSTSIKLGSKSSLHMDLALKGKLIFKPQKHFIYGSEFHLMLFEPEKFKQEYFISDKHLGKKLNTDKAALLREKIFNNGKERIDVIEGEKMKRAMDSLYKHPGIRELIETPGKIESSLIWKNEYDFNCKAKCDKIIQNNFIVDLKTTKDASAFKSESKKFGYGIQGLHYSNGYKAIFNDSNIEFVFIVIDKEEPFLCDLYSISEKTMKESIKEYSENIKKWIDYKNNPSMIYEPKEI